jgi:predicted nuclease of restriction endonuclease-like (RecB) superfamily
MARKQSDTPKAKDKTSARPGRLPPARRESAADALPASYAALLNDLKGRIRTAQVKATLAVNRELIGLYWDIGRSIVERQKAEGWGKSVVDRLAADLEKEFPGESGFSPGNVWRMRAFYLAWTEGPRDVASLANQGHWEKLQQAAGELPRPVLAQPARELDGSNLPQPVAEIPWFHNVVLIEKLKNPIERLWYARQTTEQGWSRAVLVHQIETDLYRRQGRALTNFDRTIPAPDSDLASPSLLSFLRKQFPLNNLGAVFV